MGCDSVSYLNEAGDNSAYLIKGGQKHWRWVEATWGLDYTSSQRMRRDTILSKTPQPMSNIQVLSQYSPGVSPNCPNLAHEPASKSHPTRFPSAPCKHDSSAAFINTSKAMGKTLYPKTPRSQTRPSPSPSHHLSRRPAIRVLFRSCYVSIQCIPNNIFSTL